MGCAGWAQSGDVNRAAPPPPSPPHAPRAAAAPNARRCTSASAAASSAPWPTKTHGHVSPLRAFVSVSVSSPGSRFQNDSRAAHAAASGSSRKGGAPLSPSVTRVAVIVHANAAAGAPGGGVKKTSTSSSDCSHAYTSAPPLRKTRRVAAVPTPAAMFSGCRRRARRRGARAARARRGGPRGGRRRGRSAVAPRGVGDGAAHAALSRCRAGVLRAGRRAHQHPLAISLPRVLLNGAVRAI